MYTSPNKSLELASLQRNLANMSRHATRTGRVKKKRRKKSYSSLPKVRTHFQNFICFLTHISLQYIIHSDLHSLKAPTKRRRGSSCGKKRTRKRRKRRK